MPRIITRDTAVELPGLTDALGGLFQGDLAISLDTDTLYYWDGSTWVVLVSVGGAPQLTRVELDFGSVAVDEKVFTVIDASVVPASRVVMTHSGAPATGKQADEAEFDAIDCRCEPLTGSFRVYATSLLGKVLGPFKFDYVVQA
jgi:hypothetical protein